MLSFLGKIFDRLCLSMHRYLNNPLYFTSANVLMMLFLYIYASMLNIPVVAVFLSTILGGFQFALCARRWPLLASVFPVFITSCLLYGGFFLVGDTAGVYPDSVVWSISLVGISVVSLVALLSGLLALPFRKHMPHIKAAERRQKEQAKLERKRQEYRSERLRRLTIVTLAFFVQMQIIMPLAGRLVHGVEAAEILTPDEVIENYDPEATYDSYSETRVDPNPKRRIPLDKDTQTEGEGADEDTGENGEEGSEGAHDSDHADRDTDEDTAIDPETQKNRIDTLKNLNLSKELLHEMYRDGTITGDEFYDLAADGHKRGLVPWKTRWESLPLIGRVVRWSDDENTRRTAIQTGKAVVSFVSPTAGAALFLVDAGSALDRNLNDGKVTKAVTNYVEERISGFNQWVAPHATPYVERASKVIHSTVQGTQEFAAGVYQGAKDVVDEGVEFVKENPVQALAVLGLGVALLLVITALPVIGTILTIVTTFLTGLSIFQAIRQGGIEGLMEMILSEETMELIAQKEFAQAAGRALVEVSLFIIENLPPTNLQFLKFLRLSENVAALKRFSATARALTDSRTIINKVEQVGKLTRSGKEVLVLFAQRMAREGDLAVHDMNQFLKGYNPENFNFGHLIGEADLYTYLNKRGEMVDDLATKGIEFTTAKQIFGQDLKGLMAMVGGGGTSFYIRTNASLPRDTKNINLTKEDIYYMEDIYTNSHPIERHVGKSVQYLAERANTLPNGVASSYYDIETYINTTNTVLGSNRFRIMEWLATPGGNRLTIEFNNPTGKSLGLSVRRNSSKPNAVNSGKIILEKNNAGQYYIVTNYLE